jgi:hypothetical protein
LLDVAAYATIVTGIYAITAKSRKTLAH